MVSVLAITPKVSMNKNTSQGQIHHSFTRSSCFLPDDSAGKIAKDESVFLCQHYSTMILHARI
jgi:hypothetical protein